MEPFLSSLESSIRDEVLEAVSEFGEERLRDVAMLYYVDVDGLDMWTWPTQEWTAKLIALQFLREIRFESERFEKIDVVLESETTHSAGLLSGVIAGTVGAAATVAGAKGMLLLSSKVAQRRWEEINIDYTNLRTVAQSIAAGAIRNTTSRSNWDLIGKIFYEMGFDSQTWENQVAVRYGNDLMSGLVGVLGRASWSGQRAVMEQLPGGMILPDFQAAVGPWARQYTRQLVTRQTILTARSARHSMNRYLEESLESKTIGARLATTLGLTDRDALSVDNYRRRLQNQRTKGGRLNRLVQGHANRLRVAHTDRLARTEVMASINFGQQMMWQKAMVDGLLPMDTEKIWVTAKDERVCPVCRPMDRTRTALMAGFDTSSGNVLVPPIHPNCRCLVMLAEPRIVNWGGEWLNHEVSGRSARLESTSPIGKHLGGATGKDDHPSGTPQTIHNKGGSGTPQTIHNKGGRGQRNVMAFAGLAALFAAGVFVLRRPPPGMTVLPVPGITSLPSGVVLPHPSQVKSLLSGELHTYATKMNKGVNPKVAWIDDIVEMVKGSNTGFRSAYEGGSLTGRMKDFATMVSGAPATNERLFRGLMNVSDDAYRSYVPGKTFTMGPSSFSTGSGWTEAISGTRNATVFVTKPNTRALSIDSWRKGSRMSDEAEWLVSGNFRITRVQDSFGTRIVEVEQIGLLNPGTLAQWVAKMLEQVGKREVKVRAHERDGQTVKEHLRRIQGDDGSWISDGLKRLGIERDDDLSATEAVLVGILGVIAFRTGLKVHRGPSVWANERGIRQIKGKWSVTDEMEDILRKTYAGKFANGFETKITKIEVARLPDGPFPQQIAWSAFDEGIGGSIGSRIGTRVVTKRKIGVEGLVYRNGNKVGDFAISVDPKVGRVWHDGLYMASGSQGKGFSNAWAGQMGGSYLETGVREVAVNTAQIGGYAWAKLGFGWMHGPSSDVRNALVKARSGERGFRPTAAVVKEIDDILARMGPVERLTSNTPTPLEIANIGRASGTPVGKQILTGTHWTGRIKLSDIPRASVGKHLLYDREDHSTTDHTTSGMMSP